MDLESTGPTEEEQFPTVVERKYKIKRFRRRYESYTYWAAEVWPPGAATHACVIMHRVDDGTLKTATDEAARVVKVMIRNGGRIPASELARNDVVFDTREGLDGLNPKSLSGKRQWCPAHWKLVEGGMIGRTHNGIVAGMLLVSAFLGRVKNDGLLAVDVDHIDPHTMEMLRDSYSPMCCWLGEAAVDEILFASRNEEIEKSGVLRELEEHLRRKS